MATQVSDALREQLTELGQDPNNFAGEFDRWKAQGPAGEYDSYLFGKDGAYAAPPVNGKRNVLRHVHLVPLLDLERKAKWDRDWDNKGRRTSNRVLVYVSDPRHGHLLLFILDEPTAHDVAEMRTPDDKTLMRQFAVVADHFIQTGKVAA